MDTQTRMEHKAIMENNIDDEFEDEMEEEASGDKRKQVYGRKGSSGGSGSGGGVVSPPSCQVEKCTVDLTDAKRYHKRHKVCEVHAKSTVVVIAGIRQRFCQQCSRFHELSEFDEAKRSCRRRLAGHNERRRKNSAEESTTRKVVSTPQGKETQSWKSNERGGNYYINVPGGSCSYSRNSQIK